MEAIKMHQAECDKYRQKIIEQGLDGPWFTEPDRVEFKNLGYDCLLSRSPFSFAWCGYVAVPKGHSAFGLHYDHADLEDIRVPGGLTYSKECHEHICHEADEHSDPVWWLGFDCAHCYDVTPGSEASLKAITGEIRKCPADYEVTYKDMNYVREQVLSLATQLKLLEEIKAKLKPTSIIGEVYPITVLKNIFEQLGITTYVFSYLDPADGCPITESRGVPEDVKYIREGISEDLKEVK